MADSAFEYFLKQYLLTNQSEPESLALYMRTMRGIIDHNLFLSPTRSFLYVTDISARTGTPSRRFEHLSCFLPGLFALGADQLPASAFAPFSDYAEEGGIPSEMVRHQWAAKGLAIACGAMYADMPTGLGADEVAVISASEIERERIRQERFREQERIKAEKAKADALEKEKIGMGRRAPPHLPNDNYKPRPKVDVSRPVINQTAEDIKLRWGNVLAAWREGKYDGTTDTYILEDDEDEGRIFGNMWRDWKKGARKGPVPGLRDPPRAVPEDSEMGRDYRSRNPSYQLRPEVRLLSFALLSVKMFINRVTLDNRKLLPSVAYDR